MDRLWSRVRRLVQVHTHASDIYEYEPRESTEDRLSQARQGDADRYAYLELKVRGMVPIQDMVVCLYPAKHARRVHAFLDRMNFGGWRVPFRYAGPLADASGHDDEERARWASAATQAILEWAAKPCARAATQPDAVKSPGAWGGSSPYRAVAQYSLRPDHELDAQYKNRFRWRFGYCPE